VDKIILVAGNENGKHWIAERIVSPNDPDYKDILEAQKIAPHTVKDCTNETI